jgi:hypothetical protein
MLNCAARDFVCRAAIAVLIGFALGGCEAMKEPHKSLADVIKPFGGRVMVEGKEVGSHVPADTIIVNGQPVVQTKTGGYKEACVKAALKSTVDIDTLYARAMSRFSFTTNEQQAQKRQQQITHMTSDNFKHTTQAGTYYALADSVSLRDNPSLAVWLELTMAREGKTVIVTTLTCANENDPAYKARIDSFAATLSKMVAP